MKTDFKLMLRVAIILISALWVSVNVWGQVGSSSTGFAGGGSSSSDPGSNVTPTTTTTTTTTSTSTTTTTTTTSTTTTTCCCDCLTLSVAMDKDYICEGGFATVTVTLSASDNYSATCPTEYLVDMSCPGSGAIAPVQVIVPVGGAANALFTAVAPSSAVGVDLVTAKLVDCDAADSVPYTVFNVKIKDPSGAAAPRGVYVGASAGYAAVVAPPGLAGSYVWTRTGAGIAALVGDLSQTVSVEAGALPSVSVNAEKLNVKFTPDGSAEASQDSTLLTVVEVKSVSVDASSDIGPTKINYKMKPAGAAYPATFSAPGITESRPSVGDDFFFNYSQNDLGDGDNPIKLTCLGHEVAFMATKTPKSKGPANEEVIATMLWDTEGAVGYVNIPIQQDMASPHQLITSQAIT